SEPENGKTPIAMAAVAELSAALTSLLAKGLPVREAQAGEILPNLRSVFARAVVPSEPASRLQALNELLPRLIAAVADPGYREAVQTLFALAPGARGSTHTERRRRVAGILEYHPDHVRSVIEAQLVEAVAVLLQSDLLRYQARVKRAVESLEPTGY